MRYPYAEARNFFTRELKKEERKWLRFISQSEVIVEKMESYLPKMDPNELYYGIYVNYINATRQGIKNATEELESVRRNIESINQLRRK